MKNGVSFHQFQGEKELLRVGAHRLDVKAHFATVLLQNFAQIQTKREIIYGGREGGKGRGVGFS